MPTTPTEIKVEILPFPNSWLHDGPGVEALVEEQKVAIETAIMEKYQAGYSLCHTGGDHTYLLLIFCRKA